MNLVTDSMSDDQSLELKVQKQFSDGRRLDQYIVSRLVYVVFCLYWKFTCFVTGYFVEWFVMIVAYHKHGEC